MHIHNPIKDFIISADTLVLQSFRHESRLKTRIIQDDKKMVYPRRTIHVMRATCRHYGTSLDVVTRGAKEILNDRHKVPIVIGVDRGFPLIYFPTMSPKSEDNIWIALHAIVNYKSDEPGFTNITLTNNFVIEVPVSEPIIQRQISLAHLLKVNYERRFFKFYGTLVHRPHTFI